MDDIFKALNDPTRRKILTLLKKGDMSAGDIANYFNISKPSISHHLDLLKRAELISADRVGQFIYYSINTSVLEDLMKWMIDLRKGNDEN